LVSVPLYTRHSIISKQVNTFFVQFPTCQYNTLNSKQTNTFFLSFLVNWKISESLASKILSIFSPKASFYWKSFYCETDSNNASTVLALASLGDTTQNRRQNDAQPNDNKHYDIKRNEAQHKDTQHNDE